MASTLEPLFPRQANNDYRGGKLPLYVYYLVIAQQAFSSVVHYFTHDSGKVRIAGMIHFEGEPDPNEMVWAIGAVAGVSELIILGLFLVVLWRYRNLIPLMFLVVVLEGILRYGVTVMHPIGPEYFVGTPPAKVALLPKLFVGAVMLVVSVRNSRHGEAPAT